MHENTHDDVLLGGWELTEWETTDEIYNELSSDDGKVENEGDDVRSISNPSYVDSLESISGLHLLREQEIRTAYENKGEVGLFLLFVSKNFRTKLLHWTNEKLTTTGEKRITISEMDAYLGLEIGMSINAFNDIRDYWSEKRFLGQEDFKSTMSRNRFQLIRSNIQLHPSEDIAAYDKRDPLWHSRYILNHFQKSFIKFAVPYGVSSFDESSVRTKAKTRAKSYIPSKPDKYAIRFYTAVGWSSLYIHSFWDNGSGNTTGIIPVERYLKLFPNLRTPTYRTMNLVDVSTKINTPSALWAAMIGHQTKILSSPSGKRIIVCDNFYTRHTLAYTIKRLSDNETRIIGTVRINLVDKWNKIELVKSVKRVSDSLHHLNGYLKEQAMRLLSVDLAYHQCLDGLEMK